MVPLTTVGTNLFLHEAQLIQLAVIQFRVAPDWSSWCLLNFERFGSNSGNTNLFYHLVELAPIQFWIVPMTSIGAILILGEAQLVRLAPILFWLAPMALVNVNLILGSAQFVQLIPILFSLAPI